MPSYFGSYAKRGLSRGAASSEASMGRGSAYGIDVAHSVVMTDPLPPDEAAPPERIHRFVVTRGMAVVLVVESVSWYVGLLQAALARVVIEGHN